METDLRADLVGDAGIAALVANRVYAGVLSTRLKDDNDADWPSIAFREVSGVRIGGVCMRRRMQVDIYARSYTAMKAVRDALETLANGKINWEYIEGPDLYEFDSGLHHQVVDIVIS